MKQTVVGQLVGHTDQVEGSFKTAYASLYLTEKKRIILLQEVSAVMPRAYVHSDVRHWILAMGICMSSPPPRPMGYLDRRIREQLRSYVANEPELKRTRSFHAVVSTFDSMLRSFRGVRAVFDRMDADSSDTIDFDEFLIACEQLRVRKRWRILGSDDGVTADTLRALYLHADSNGDGTIDFREFVCLLALLYLMSDPAAPAMDDLHYDTQRVAHSAMTKALGAWLVFDPKGDGFIRRSQVTNVLDSLRLRTVHPQDRDMFRSLRKRLRGLPWDIYDTVTLQAFLMAVQEWTDLIPEETGSESSGRASPFGPFLSLTPRKSPVPRTLNVTPAKSTV